LAIKEKQLGLAHSITLNIASNYVKFLLQQGRKEEATAVITRFPGLQARFPQAE
jgi:hypothetical protein